MSETNLHNIEAALSTVQQAADKMEVLSRNMGGANQEAMKAFATTVVTSASAVVAQLQHLNNLGYFAEDSDNEGSSADCSEKDGDSERSNDDAHDGDIEDDSEGESGTSSCQGSNSDQLPSLVATATASHRVRAAPSTDSANHALADRAGSNSALEDVMKIVAAGRVTKKQISLFGRRDNELGKEGAGDAFEESGPTSELHDTRATTKRRRADFGRDTLNTTDDSRLVSILNHKDGSSIVTAGDAIKGWLEKLHADVDDAELKNVQGGSSNRRCEAHENTHEEAKGQ